MARPRIYPDRVMSTAERQARFRAKGGGAARLNYKRIAVDPQSFARALRRSVGYLDALAVRDAIDKALDDWLDADGDAVPTAYLIRNDLGR